MLNGAWKRQDVLALGYFNSIVLYCIQMFDEDQDGVSVDVEL